jgi:uncharacterized protein (DUF433 family)
LAGESDRDKIEDMEPIATMKGNDVPAEATTTLPVSREHIVCTPDTCGGKPRIAGTRIQVKHLVVMHYRQGMSPDQIVSELPHLTLADVHAALAYYHDHREAINAEIAADRTWYEEMRARSPSRVQGKFRQRKADAPNDPVSSG